MRQIITTVAFDNWLRTLTVRSAAKRIHARIKSAGHGNLGDCAPVGNGVSEMRIHCGPGYRVYYVLRGAETVILLAGGDRSSQAKDIRLAQRLARDL